MPHERRCSVARVRAALLALLTIAACAAPHDVSPRSDASPARDTGAAVDARDAATGDDGCGAAGCSDADAPVPACGPNTTPVHAEPSDVVALGDVFVGQARSVPVALTNAATGSPVVVTALALRGDEALSYALAPTSPSPPALPWSLGAGGATWLTVTYRPTRAGTVTGALTVTTSAGTICLAVTARAVDLTAPADVTAFGARGDGTHDDTAAFRAAAATGRIVRVPAPPGGQFYRLTGTVRLTGPGIVGSDASRPLIRMDGATGSGITAPDHWGHVMFALDDYAGAEPAVFTGLHLDGGWNGTSPVLEWDHLIMLRHCRNVIVEHNVLENPMGDCVLVGGEGKDPSAQITVSSNVCRNPWRDTFSDVASSGEVRVIANVLEKRNGFFPEDGAGAYYQTNVDFEPNPSTAGFLDYVRGAEVAYNHIVSRRVRDQPGGTGVGFCHQGGLPAGQPPNGDVRVHDNTGDAPFGFLVFPCPDPWTNITGARNPDPNGCMADGARRNCM